jgi:UDP-glucose 4-epimerase
MTRFLKDPKAPVLWGFDPMMQIIHEDDVVGALAHAVLDDVPGVFNIAAEGTSPLSKLMGLAGKFGVPVLHLLAYWTTPLGSSQLAPIEWDYLRYPWVGDLEKMRQEFGFAPSYTAAEALREFAARQRVRQYLPESAALAFDEERLRDTIERRRRERSAQGVSE